MKPALALLIPDTLAGIGLSDIIHRMMPGAETCVFPSFAEFEQHPDAGHFFHYFVTSLILLSHAPYFLQRQRKTIVLVQGGEWRMLPKGFHYINVQQSEKELVRNILSLAKSSHEAHGPMPDVVQKAQCEDSAVHCGAPRLTARECDVLRGVVKGLINKEIADQLGVCVATVITHRKNLTEKLGTRSVSALTIYAVTHGLVRSDEI